MGYSGKSLARNLEWPLSLLLLSGIFIHSASYFSREYIVFSLLHSIERKKGKGGSAGTKKTETWNMESLLRHRHIYSDCIGKWISAAFPPFLYVDPASAAYISRGLLLSGFPPLALFEKERKEASSNGAQVIASCSETRGEALRDSKS